MLVYIYLICIIYQLEFCYGFHNPTQRITMTGQQQIRNNNLLMMGYNPWQLPKLNFGSNKNNFNSKKSSSSKNVNNELDCLIVGSGISGSTAAYYMDKAGANIVLAEIKDEVGGNLISKRKDGFLWEEGPNSFQPNPYILRFAKDLGIIDELVLANPTLPRFVFWEGKLFALPGALTDLPFFNLYTIFFALFLDIYLGLSYLLLVKQL